MSEISTRLIKKAVYNLCFDANICINKEVYSRILKEYLLSEKIEAKEILKAILQNAKIAYEKKLPLCQDTGQVIVFLKIGQKVKIKGEFINKAINEAVEKCYIDNCFRKSVVENSLFDRKNTKTNTPVVIHTEYVNGDDIKISVLIKGAGSENKSVLKMFLPTIQEEELVHQIGDIILETGENACPPMFIGIGIGYTAEKSSIIAKEAFIKDKFTKEELEFSEKVKKYIEKKAPEKYGSTYVLDIRTITGATHIACLPVSISINCHSKRYSHCVVKEDGVIYQHKKPDFVDIQDTDNDINEIKTEDTKAIRNLKSGQKVLLTGHIYVARDMAHKRLCELLKEKKPLPVELRDKIIFYAGPCPAKKGEISGSIGPTTASRMDKYAVELYKNGLLATIGKGDRSKEIIEVIKNTSSKYFTAIGGVAALLSRHIKKSEIIAFEDLGAEAIYELYVEKLPVITQIS